MEILDNCLHISKEDECMFSSRPSHAVAALAVCAATASAGPITTGHLLVPFISGSSIQERTLMSPPGPPPSLMLVQTLTLPTGYHYTTGQVTSVIVRPSDHHIF